LDLAKNTPISNSSSSTTFLHMVTDDQHLTGHHSVETQLESNQKQSQVELVCSPRRVTVGFGYTHLKEKYV
jgi:hypothetical protein